MNTTELAENYQDSIDAIRLDLKERPDDCRRRDDALFALAQIEQDVKDEYAAIPYLKSRNRTIASFWRKVGGMPR